MLRLTLEAIHIIDTIERTGSFTAAAEKLHKVPSTISYTINKLEEQMNIRLFERNGPKVTLTPIGKELLQEGLCLLTGARDLENRLYKMSQGVEIALNITIDDLLPLSAFSDTIAQFQQSAQNTRLHIHRETLTGTWEALIQRQADLIIAAGEGPSGGGYKTQIIGHMDFVFCVSPEHPLAKLTEPLQKNQLLQYTAIVIKDSAKDAPSRTTGLYSGQKQITVDSLADKILLQKAGVGHGFLPKKQIMTELNNKELVPLAVIEPKADETFYLAWRTNENGAALTWWINQISQNALPEVLY
ncbi:LysR family transcriptional regulator [Neisseria sp. Ec49-e6-T10]|uniref:LysR family transcriptional regulator n=1 Tax=Neisseria sp. Ec49-e6-T10 TaxID=3140744 RepID=UPI003EBEDD08